MHIFMLYQNSLHIYQNSLHEIKLWFTILILDILGVIYSARLFTLGCASGELSSGVYPPCIGGISNTYTKYFVYLGL